MENILVGAIAGGLAALILPTISKKILKLSDSVAANVSKFGVVIFAILAINLYPAYKSQNAAKIMDTEINKAIEQANVNTKDGGNVADTLREESMEKANKKIESSSGNEKKIAAASQFLGYYLVNTKTRKDYCLNFGVEITNFVKEFESVNTNDLNAARKILNTTLDAEDNFYKTSKNSFEKIINIDMTSQAKQYSVTEKQICEALEADAANIAQSMRFSVAMPVQSKVINEL
jgi:hypothetical protein